MSLGQSPEIKQSGKCVFIVGMHHSGTSILSALGKSTKSTPTTLALGQNSVQPEYSEDVEVIELNNRILAAHHQNWDSLHPVSLGFTEAFYPEIKAIYQQRYLQTSIPVFADPRLSLTLPLWHAALSELGVECYAIIMVRDPLEVSDSLVALHRFSIDKSLCLWMNYTAHAVEFAKSLEDALVVSYERLLSNAESIKEEIRNLIAEPEWVIGEILDGQPLTHERQAKPPLHLAWVLDVYEALINGNNNDAITISGYREKIHQIYPRDVIKSLTEGRPQPVKIDSVSIDDPKESIRSSTSHLGPEVESAKPLGMPAADWNALLKERDSLKAKWEAANSELAKQRSAAQRLKRQEGILNELNKRFQRISNHVKLLESRLVSKTQELAFYKDLHSSTPSLLHNRWVKAAIFRIERTLGINTVIPDLYLTHPLVFEVQYYVEANPEVKSKFGSDYGQATKHWKEEGVRKGLPSSGVFHVKHYLTENDDLAKWFRRDYKGAIKHWIDFGIKEGRSSSPVFDLKSYQMSHRDLKNEFGNDFYQLALHWTKYGNRGNQIIAKGAGPESQTILTESPSPQVKQRNLQQKIRRKSDQWDWEMEAHISKRLADMRSENDGYVERVPVSIIMPTYNRAESIRGAIDSVLSQSFTNWDLYIIDDGSTDATTSVIAPYLKDARIHLIEIAHSGVAAARNTGLEISRGDFLFYLDSDNTWDPSFLTQMVTFMTVGQLDAAYCAIRIVDSSFETKGYRGDRFHWFSCYTQNYVDMNCFGHRRIPMFKEGFDWSLKRLVDWDYILQVTATRRTSFLPLCLVSYYDGDRGQRITHTEYLGDELIEAENRIRSKHDPANFENYDLDELRLEWDEVMKRPGILNDEYSREFVERSERLIDWEQLKGSELERELVSIVVLCFNNSQLSYKCIRSVLKNSVSERYAIEVIAVDNGSTDDTAEVLMNLTKDDNRVKVVSPGENLMFSLGNNIAMNATRGEYTILLNNDTMVIPGWLDPLIDALRLDATVGIVGPKLLYEDETLQCGGLVFNDKSKIPYHVYRGQDRDSAMVKKSRVYQAVTGACMAFRTLEFLKLRGLDPGYINGCEDLDICFRMRYVLGKRILYNPHSEIFHLESKSPGRGRFILRNRDMFVSRWGELIIPDDKLTYDEDGYEVVDYYKPGTEPDGETASYVPRLKRIEEVPDPSPENDPLNLGFVSIWHPRGITFHTKQLCDAFEGSEFVTHIFARWQAEKFSNEGPTFHPRVTNAGDDPGDEELISWVITNDIRLVVFMEVHPRDWKRVKAIKELGIPVACYENLDILRKELIDQYAIFDFFIFNCFFSRKFFLSQYPEKRSIMIPWGTPISSVVEDVEDTLRFVHVAGWIGVNNRKNTSLLIRAFNLLKDPKAELHIYTQSPVSSYGDEIAAICLENDSIVVHEGTIDNVEEAYRGKSMLLWPSKREGVGLPILEALAHGLPVLVSDGYMMKQWIHPNVHGVVIHGKPLPGQMVLPEIKIDEDELARAISDLCESRRKIQELRENVLKNRFMWEWTWQVDVLCDQFRMLMRKPSYRIPDDLSYLPREVLEFEYERERAFNVREPRP